MEDYEEEVLTAINLAEKITDLEYIEDKVKRTKAINRMTKVGRELTHKLLWLCNDRARAFIDKGEPPFI